MTAAQSPQRRSSCARFPQAAWTGRWADAVPPSIPSAPANLRCDGCGGCRGGPGPAGGAAHHSYWASALQMAHLGGGPDTLVAYIYSNSDPEYEHNLEFFVRHGMREGDGCQYIIAVQHVWPHRLFPCLVRLTADTCRAASRAAAWHSIWSKNHSTLPQNLQYALNNTLQAAVLQLSSRSLYGCSVGRN